MVRRDTMQLLSIFGTVFLPIQKARLDGSATIRFGFATKATVAMRCRDAMLSLGCDPFHTSGHTKSALCPSVCFRPRARPRAHFGVRGRQAMLIYINVSYPDVSYPDVPTHTFDSMGVF